MLPSLMIGLLILFGGCLLLNLLRNFEGDELGCLTRTTKGLLSS
jgi:hypothetical protein